MANTVKNSAGGDTGQVQNGITTIKTGRTTVQQLNSPGFDDTFDIASFDLNATPQDGTNLDERFDDPRYYTGDAP